MGKLREKISEFYRGVIGSLNTKKDDGFSSRKITAVAVNILYVTTHVVWYKHAFLKEDFEHFIMISIIDALYVLLLLGIVTFEQVVKLRNGNKQIEEKK